MSVLIAMFRGFTRARRTALGNFWRDTIRGTVYILLPIAAIIAFVLVTQGVVQTLGDERAGPGVQGFEQVIARGPVGGPDRHQAAGDQRRRILQPELRPSVRGRRAAVELPRDVPDPVDPRRADLHLREVVGSRRQGWALFAAMWSCWSPGSP